MHFLQCAGLEPWWSCLHVPPVLTSNSSRKKKKKERNLDFLHFLGCAVPVVLPASLFLPGRGPALSS